MTHEENQRCAINYLIELKKSTKGYGGNWLDLAIKALEAQPMDTKTYLKRREENYVEYNVEWFLKNWELELEILSGGKIKPTDADCISRAQALHACCDEWNKDYKAIMKSIRQLPSVKSQPKIGKWIVDYRFWKCSNCDASFDTWRHEIVYNEYCPNCGAKMEEVQEVEE